MDCIETDHDEPSLHQPCHIIARFNFAKMFLDKENSTIELFGHNNVRKIWRMKSKAFLLKNTVPTLKHEGAMMMFWVFFIAQEELDN